MGTDKREGREAQGCAWASQASMDFQIPSQASLHWIMKTHRPFCYANGPVSLRNLWKIWGCSTAHLPGAWLWLKAILDFIPLELFTSHL
jgi:hypothetical protein